MAEEAGNAAQAVAPGVWILRLRGVNAYAVAGPDGTVLVDAGNPGDGPRILGMLEAAGVPAPRRILLTHADVDHAGGAREIVRRTGAELLASAGEADVLGGKASPKLFRRLARIATGRMRCSGRLVDGEEVSGLRVVATPGHTAGHVCLWREDGAVLFAGDALSVREGTARIPPAFFTEDRRAAENSLARLAALAPALVLPGHGSPLRDAAETLRAASAASPAVRTPVSDG